MGRDIKTRLIHTISRSTLVFFWFYQGLVPKIIGKASSIVSSNGESENIGTGLTDALIFLIGAGQIVFAILILVFWRQKLVLLLGVLALLIGLSLSLASKDIYMSLFNPVSTYVTVMSMTVIALITCPDSPKKPATPQAPKENKKAEIVAKPDVELLDS